MHLAANLADTVADTAAVVVALVLADTAVDVLDVADADVDVDAAAGVVLTLDVEPAVGVEVGPDIHLARYPAKTTSPLLLQSHSHHSIAIGGVAADAEQVVEEGGRWCVAAIAVAAAADLNSAEEHPESGCLICHYSNHFLPARTVVVVFVGVVVAAVPAADDDWA